MARYILALDQGTTSSRAIVFDAAGRIVSLAQQEFPQIYPSPGLVEHDPEAIWGTQTRTARDALVRAGAGAERRGGNRHHQSARDHHRLGARHRPADPQRHRLAEPPDRADLRAS